MSSLCSRWFAIWGLAGCKVATLQAARLQACRLQRLQVARLQRCNLQWLHLQSAQIVNHREHIVETWGSSPPQSRMLDIMFTVVHDLGACKCNRCRLQGCRLQACRVQGCKVARVQGVFKLPKRGFYIASICVCRVGQYGLGVGSRSQADCLQRNAAMDDSIGGS